MTRKAWSGLAGATALGLLLVLPAHAQQAAPVVEYMAPDGYSRPAGMQLGCMANPVSGGASKTCPVVKYQGITTFAYSYNDNRMAFALVSYDAQKNIVRNVEHPGPRYIYNAVSSLPNQTVMFVGQSEMNAAVPWSDLGAVQAK